MNDQVSFSRVCPACGRRVPNKVTACRCGETLEPLADPIDAPSMAAPSAASNGRARGPLVVAGTSVLAAIAGATVFFAMKPSQPAVAAPVAAPAAPAAQVRRQTAPPAQEAEAENAAPLDAESRVRAAFARGVEPATSTPAASTMAGAAPAPVMAVNAAASPLEDVIGRAMPAVVRVEASGGFGSGFFVSPDTIVTNVHVVGGNSSVTIRRPDGTTTPARVDTTAAEFDIAILRISNADPNQPTLAMGSGMQARAGQEVIALGTPLGLQNTVTRGIVSAVRAVNGVTLVQTDAAINPGNSGGPLVDRSGSVIAIATMGMRSAVAQGLSFGVAIEHAQALLSGRRTVATGTPVAGLSQAMTARQGVSESDVAREASTRAYEQVIASTARKADDLDDRWRTFKGACYEGRVAGAFDREWFAFWEQKAMQGAVSPGCGQMFADLRRSAEDVRGTVVSADEAARQAGVYPGRRREILKRYRLDYSGWER